MLYAYGATVVEIVRRKEFCELDYSLSCVMELSSDREHSPILLSAGAEHLGGYGKDVVRMHVNLF